MPSDTAERMSPIGPGTAAAALSSACVKMPTNAWPTTGASFVTTPGNCSTAVDTMVARRGTMLDAAVATESTSSPVSLPMSASSLPSSVTQFSQAAFAMLQEPSMVVAASREVVPAICICSCIVWMASTMLSKDRLDSSTAELTACASLTRRCISSLVPP